MLCYVQLAPALTSLADVSCWEQINKLRGRQYQDVAIDTRYSSRHWHANEITTVARNAQSGLNPLFSFLSAPVASEWWSITTTTHQQQVIRKAES